MVKCEIADAIEQKYGIKACCDAKQTGEPCGLIGAEECSWGPNCTECGDPTVQAYDPCFGWNCLCMNPECVMDK